MATTKARPRMPSSGYRNKYYDPAKAHKYYLSKRKLKGYKDRYKNSDRRRKKTDDDELTDAQRRQREEQQSQEEEEQERQELEQEAAEQEEEDDQSSRKMYAHTGDARTGIHAARGWTVMQAQEAGEAARYAAGRSNAQIKAGGEDRSKALVPEGYVIPDKYLSFVEQYEALVGRIRGALRNVDADTAKMVGMQLDELDSRMRALVSGVIQAEDAVGDTTHVTKMRRKLDRYQSALTNAG